MKFLTSIHNAAEDAHLAEALSVRNTFLNVKQDHDCAQKRIKSLPPSFKPVSFLTLDSRPSCETPEMCKATLVSDYDDSTDTRTEISDDPLASEYGNTSSYGTSSSCDNTPHNCIQCEPCLIGVACPSPVQWGGCAMPAMWMLADSQAGGVQAQLSPSGFPPTPLSAGAVQFTPSDKRNSTPTPRADETQQAAETSEDPAQALAEATPKSQQAKLSSKAAAFQPAQNQAKTSMDIEGQIAEMLDATVPLIAVHGRDLSIASVDVSQTEHGWAISLTHNKKKQVSINTMLDAVKNALLAAAGQSKNVYVLGYSSMDTAFEPKPQGFEAQLAITDSTKSCCHAFLKKGHCRYEGNCNHAHPLLQVPVQVFVELTCFDAPAETVYYFKKEAALILTTVAASLASLCWTGARAFTEDADDWRIEIYVREEDDCLKDHFLNHAKKALVDAVGQSSTAYLMGTAAPFLTKSSGFVATLGEMVDKNQACWDVYMQGSCRRHQSCRWLHPQCSLPINVVLKKLRA
jgi:hypothetical protein